MVQSQLIEATRLHRPPGLGRSFDLQI